MEQDNHRSLMRNMVLSVGLVTAMPLFLLALIFGRVFHTTYHQAVLDGLAELAASQAALADRAGAGATALAFRRGETGLAVALGPDGSLLRPAAPLPESHLDLVREMALSEDGAAAREAKTAGGSRVVLAGAPLADGGRLVLVQDSSEALGGLYEARVLAATTIGALLMVVVYNAFVLSGDLLQRIMAKDEENRRLFEKMEEANRLAALGELAAGIAHEMNTPLAIIQQEAGWISDMANEESFPDNGDVAEVRRAMDQIRSQSGRCGNITRMLLNLARRDEPKLEPVQVNDIVRDVMDLAVHRATSLGISLAPDLAADLPMVTGQAGPLRQVVVNLVNNALDAMAGQGGVLTAATSRDMDEVSLDVTDTGVGIPAERLKRIFEPFYTTKPVGKGTGLGLSICYGIVKRLGGRLIVRSHAGQGSTFSVRMPVHEPEALPKRSDAPVLGQALPGPAAAQP